MAQTKTVTRSWEDVVNTTCEASGMPKKQVTETAEAVHKAIQSELSSHQPKRDGDVLQVETLYGKYVSTRVSEQVITDSAGNKFTRPSCCAVNFSMPTEYISAANLGLVDDAAILSHSAHGMQGEEVRRERLLPDAVGDRPAESQGVRVCHGGVRRKPEGEPRHLDASALQHLCCVAGRCVSVHVR